MMGVNLRSRYDPPVPAIVLAEEAFGEVDGKTANGVVMHSELFEVSAVIDSSQAGSTADEVLSRRGVGAVPVVESTAEALSIAPDAKALILGVAPAGGQLPDAWLPDIREAMAGGCDVVSGLHVFLSEDQQWRDLAEEQNVDLIDVRKPPDSDDLRVADGRADEVAATVVLVAGTDCASGKRTTTFELYRAARAAGIDAAWVATGQTGIMIGAHRGVVADRVPADFVSGAIEDMVCALGDRDLVFVEGQAALTHRAYGGVTLSILTGAWPDAIVMADDPDRRAREHFEQFEKPSANREIELVEALSDARVVAVSTWGDSTAVADRYDRPVENVYEDGGPDALLRTVREAVDTETS